MTSEQSSHLSLNESIAENSEKESFWLPIDSIQENAIFQPRGRENQLKDKGINQDVVDQYCEWLAYSEPPAIEVWFGELNDKEGWWLLSGHHRIRALKKANRDKVECVQKANSLEHAIYRASLSNAGGHDRTRQIYMMNKEEWKQACKQFLRIKDKLSAEAIAEFLNEAANITGQTKKWSKINDSAIAAVFGLSRASVISYQKQLDLEEAAKNFPIGCRVLLKKYDETDYCGDVSDRKYRLGTVIDFNVNMGLDVEFDFHRCKNKHYHPSNLEKVDDAIVEQPEFWQVGDRIWHEDYGYGVVIQTSPTRELVQLRHISQSNPLICWENGRHTNFGLSKADYEGTAEIPSLETRIAKLSEYLNSTTEDEIGSYAYSEMERLLYFLKQQSTNQDEKDSPIPQTIDEEIQSQRKKLLGRNNPAGDDAELPDIPNYPENPEYTATETWEQPTDSMIEMRVSQSLNYYNGLLTNIIFLPSKELKQLIELAEQELERREEF
jgi:hypothetical protein